MRPLTDPAGRARPGAEDRLARDVPIYVTSSPSRRARRQLHVNATPLRLPNAWDAGSARLFESQGATAIRYDERVWAWALGYRDGRHLPVDEVVAAAARIARVLTVLLSFDIMSG